MGCVHCVPLMVMKLLVGVVACSGFFLYRCIGFFHGVCMGCWFWSLVFSRFGCVFIGGRFWDFLVTDCVV